MRATSSGINPVKALRAKPVRTEARKHHAAQACSSPAGGGDNANADMLNKVNVDSEMATRYVYQLITVITCAIMIAITTATLYATCTPSGSFGRKKALKDFNSRRIELELPQIKILGDVGPNTPEGVEPGQVKVSKDFNLVGIGLGVPQIKILGDFCPNTPEGVEPGQGKVSKDFNLVGIGLGVPQIKILGDFCPNTPEVQNPSQSQLSPPDTRPSKECFFKV